MLFGPDARPVTFLLTRDPAALLPFYEGILGLTVLGRDPYGIELALGQGAVLRLTTIGDHQPGPHTVMGWTTPDFDASLDRLIAAGVKPDIFEGFGQDARGVWTAPGGRKKIIWFKDPEGNGLSVSSP